MSRTSDVVELYRLNGTWHVRTVEDGIIRYASFGAEQFARHYAGETAERLAIKVDCPTGE